MTRSTRLDSARRSCTPSAAARIVSAMSTSSSDNSIASASIEARSRMSLMMARSAGEDFVTYPAYSKLPPLSGPTAGSPSSWMKPMMLVNGERNS